MNYAEFEAMLAEDLPHLSTRIRTAIQHGLHKRYDYVPTVGDIIATSDKEILKTPNIGKKSVRELRLIIEQQATQHGICISEFKGVQRRLYIALIDGLELVGEKRMVEELLKAIKQAKTAFEIKRNLREVIESISPSETPFMSVRSNVELNQYEWRTTL